MRSRLQLFELEIQQACYFYSPAKLTYWHVLSSFKYVSFFGRLARPANKALSGMLGETTAVVKTWPMQALLNDKVLLSLVRSTERDFTFPAKCYSLYLFSRFSILSGLFPVHEQLCLCC